MNNLLSTCVLLRIQQNPVNTAYNKQPLILNSHYFRSNQKIDVIFYKIKDKFRHSLSNPSKLFLQLLVRPLLNESFKNTFLFFSLARYLSSVVSVPNYNCLQFPHKFDLDERTGLNFIKVIFSKVENKRMLTLESQSIPVMGWGVLMLRTVPYC